METEHHGFLIDSCATFPIAVQAQLEEQRHGIRLDSVVQGGLTIAISPKLGQYGFQWLWKALGRSRTALPRIHLDRDELFLVGAQLLHRKECQLDNRVHFTTDVPAQLGAETWGGG